MTELALVWEQRKRYFELSKLSPDERSEQWLREANAQIDVYAKSPDVPGLPPPKRELFERARAELVEYMVAYLEVSFLNDKIVNMLDSGWTVYVQSAVPGSVRVRNIAVIRRMQGRRNELEDFAMAKWEFLAPEVKAALDPNTRTSDDEGTPEAG